MTRQSESEEYFEKFLEVALQESPPDVAEQLRAGLKKRYEKPPVDEMALCLHRSVPLSKARKILFAPDEDDMRLYPALIAMPPPDAPNNHPQRNLQVCALASLYLVHSKSWERVRPFIEAGGLRQLAAALAHSNPYLASQAMSALLHITDEELLFPWHDPPPTPDGRGPRQGPYAAVWRALFDLSGGGGGFLPNLLAHYRHPAVFPGASYMALRLLAFYLSWMRRHFTQDNRLSLSASLLAMLERWAADPRVTAEERELASALHQDFSRFPPAKEPQPPAAGGDAAAPPGTEQQQPHLLGGLDGDEEDPRMTVVSERTEINSGPSSDNEAELLKEQGNEAYKRGDFTAAVQLYSAALDSLVPQERLLTEGPRRAAYHANRAAAYMARAAAGKLREGDADTAGYLEGVDHGSQGVVARHYEAAVLDCDAALELQPTGRAAAKTLLRKSRALLQLGRREAAEAAARSGLGKCDSASDGPVGELRGELQEALRAAATQQAGKAKAGGKEAQARAQPSADAATTSGRAEPETAAAEAAAAAETQPEAGAGGKAPVVVVEAQARVAAPAPTAAAPGEDRKANGSDPCKVTTTATSATTSRSSAIDWNAMD